jgi:hypothetical protein
MAAAWPSTSGGKSLTLNIVPPGGGMTPRISALRSGSPSAAGLPAVAQRLRTTNPGCAGIRRTCVGGPSSATYDFPEALIAVTMRLIDGSSLAMKVSFLSR